LQQTDETLQHNSHFSLQHLMSAAAPAGKPAFQQQRAEHAQAIVHQTTASAHPGVNDDPILHYIINPQPTMVASGTSTNAFNTKQHHLPRSSC
jgi:hypothetical protein